MRQDAYQYAALVTFCLGIVPVSQADLKPISEAEMSQVQGQAMIAVDRMAGVNHQFTRVTMGMDAEIQANIDTVALGETASGTDLDVAHLSLGHIARDDTRVQIDGQTYNIGDIVPFVGADPYFELAELNGEVVGFRFGLNRARGTLSGDIASFSGNLGLQIEDDAGNVSAATLFDATTQATNYQATHVGLAGDTTDCASGVQCAPLSNLKSLNIGTDNGDGTVGFTEDFFLAFQKEAVDWQNVDGSTVINAAQGVFLNLPTSMTIDLQTLQNGIPRERTEYIDRGMGLF